MAGSGLRGSNVGQADRDVEMVDTASLLSAYDRLPARLRELYDQSPEAFNAIEWLQAVGQYGEARTEELILAALRKQYPAWAPIERIKKGNKR